MGNVQRLLDSLWTILKGHWKAAGKCPKTLIPPRQMFLLAGCVEKSRKEASPNKDKAEFLNGYQQKRGNFHPFSMKVTFMFIIHLKVEGAVKTLSGSSPIFALLTIPF